VAWDEKNDNDGILKSSRISDNGCLLTGEPSMYLKTMTVSKLKELKYQVEAAIHAKVTERRHEIESELSRLSRFDDGRGAKVVRAGARGMVAVKYRNSGPSLSRQARSWTSPSLQIVPKAQHQSGQKRPERPTRRERLQIVWRRIFYPSLLPTISSLFLSSLRP
jgi:hypothetical protein